MQRVLPRGLALATLGLALLALRPAAHAADTPFKGTWKLTATDSGQDITLALIKIEGDEKAPAISLAEAGVPVFRDANIEGAQGDGGGVRFTVAANGIDFRFAAGRGRADAKVLLGSVQIRNQFLPVTLERTTDTSIDTKNFAKPTPGADALKELRGADAAKQDDIFKGLAEKFPERPILVLAAREILLARSRGGADADQLHRAADAYLRAAAVFGPEMEVHAAGEAASFLGSSEKGSALSLDYARKAEKLLPRDAPAGRQADVLKTLAAALRKNGKDDELKAVQARLARLDETLDAEFEKTAVPFKVEAYEGRKEKKADRVVAVELFTGAQCPPCVAADVAFDALLKRYKPTEVVLLQYHLHIPGPDPLTGADSEKRADAYGVHSTPSLFLDGKLGPALGGPKGAGEARYKTLLAPVDEALETTAPVELRGAVERKGDRLDVTAEGKWKEGKPGDKVRLRLVLIEDMARYAGNNGQRLHHHVVRSFPGGLDGFAFQDAALKQTVRVDLAEVRKQQEDYLAQQAKNGGFPEERPLELKHLKVVLLVQEEGGKILQARQLDVPGEK